MCWFDLIKELNKNEDYSIEKLVLVDNVGIPTFVQDLSHVRICPMNVLPMSSFCPCPVFD